jgi:hypothetical protein
LVPHLINERLHLGGVFIADTDEYDAAVSEFLLQLGEVRDAGSAGSAPGSPELHNDNFLALDARKGERMAFDPLGDGERRGGVADFGRGDLGS